MRKNSNSKLFAFSIAYDRPLAWT